MLSADTYHPADLPAEDLAVWRALCARGPEFASPLLGPDFALAVGEVRADARVSVLRYPGRTAGFLAYHRRPGGLARPIGAPLSDYHALVAEEGLGLEEALEAIGLAAYRFTGLTNSAAAGVSDAAEREAYVIALETTADDYLEAIRAASAKRFKNYRRLDHKLDREVGELSIRAPDDDRAAFETLLRWKREQLARTGAHDFLGADWTQALMRNLFDRKDGAFRGLMINLYAGDRLVAGHFGVRLGDIYHPWIASTDPDLAAWSPGQVYLGRAIAAMDELGLRQYDVGPGHDHYKRPFSRTIRMVAQGQVASQTALGHAARLSDRAWALAGARRPGFADKLRRRLDTIAAVELTLAGRVKGVAAAAGSMRRSAAEAESA